MLEAQATLVPAADAKATLIPATATVTRTKDRTGVHAVPIPNHNPIDRTVVP